MFGEYKYKCKSKYYLKKMKMLMQMLCLQNCECNLYSCYRGNLVELVLCVLLGHPNSKIANSMKLVFFAFFSSQYRVFELKNISGNLIAPNSSRWSLLN